MNGRGGRGNSENFDWQHSSDFIVRVSGLPEYRVVKLPGLVINLGHQLQGMQIENRLQCNIP